jgi:hypothetical protein
LDQPVRLAVRWASILVMPESASRRGVCATKHEAVARCNEASGIPTTLRELLVPRESLEPSDDPPHEIRPRRRNCACIEVVLP